MRAPTAVCRAFTLIELVVVVAILALLAALAVPNFIVAQTRSKVSVARNNQRILGGGLIAYRVDHGSFPAGRLTRSDPFGIFSNTSLEPLTTPMAYVGPSAFRDPFGLVEPREPEIRVPSGVGGSPFDPPLPSVNDGRAMLYFFYEQFAARMRLQQLGVDGFSVISIGPDRADSFIVYYPFPDDLPFWAAWYGFEGVHDTVYDPTNGTFSGGDLARFGGSVPAPPVVGGGSL